MVRCEVLNHKRLRLVFPKGIELGIETVSWEPSTHKAYLSSKTRKICEVGNNAPRS
jgi:hypothetical protein